MKICNAVKTCSRRLEVATIRLAGYTGLSLEKPIKLTTYEEATIYENKRINAEIDKQGQRLTILLVTASWIILLVMMKMPT